MERYELCAGNRTRAIAMIIIIHRRKWLDEHRALSLFSQQKFNLLFILPFNLTRTLRVRCLRGNAYTCRCTMRRNFVLLFSWITICAIVDDDGDGGGGGCIERQTIVGDGYKLDTPSIRMYLSWAYRRLCATHVVHLRPNALKCVSIHDLCQTIQNDLMCAKCQTNWIENDMRNERTNTGAYTGGPHSNRTDPCTTKLCVISMRC